MSYEAHQGSTANVIAALASFCIPGLGQLIQGRPIMALVHFVLAGVLWLVLMGWIIHLWSIIDAARWTPRYVAYRDDRYPGDYESRPL